MKFDKSMFQELPFKLFADLAYNGTLTVNKIRIGDTVAAHREKIELTQHNYYKTQFYNPALRKALVPKNQSTLLRLYDSNGVEIINPTNFCKLLPEYGSIVFEIEPAVLPKYCECAFYDLEYAESIILKEGIRNMDPDYVPKDDKAVVTKDFLDMNLDLIKSSLHSLNSLQILQGSEELANVVCNKDNLYHNVILKNGPTYIDMWTNPFMISASTKKEDAYIWLTYGTYNLFREKLSTICEGNGKYWYVKSSEDLYLSHKEKMYLFNSYALKVNVKDFNSFIGTKTYNPDQLTLHVGDDTNSQMYGVEVGFENVNNTSFKPSISFKEVDLLSLKTEFVSGTPYLPNNEAQYDLPVLISFTNKAYDLYRYPYFEYGTVEEDKEVIKSQNLIEANFGEEYKFNLSVKISKHTKKLFVRMFNILGEEVETIYTDIDCKPCEGLEEYRVYTPNKEFPAEDELTVWNPRKQLEPFEPRFKAGTYYSEVDDSALAFRFPVNEHYSHIDLDLDTDAKDIYIKSMGNTGWLKTEGLFDVFNNPVADGESCKIEKGNYSFGRVNYKGDILVRIIGSHYTTLKSFNIY